LNGKPNWALGRGPWLGIGWQKLLQTIMKEEQRQWARFLVEQWNAKNGTDEAALLELA
jgi:hypothetical protein